MGKRLQNLLINIKAGWTQQSHCLAYCLQTLILIYRRKKDWTINNEGACRQNIIIDALTGRPAFCGFRDEGHGCL